VIYYAEPLKSALSAPLGALNRILGTEPHSALRLFCRRAHASIGGIKSSIQKKPEIRLLIFFIGFFQSFRVDLQRIA
jgi:hypothetical protein